jgi:tyrosyl-tRNA synthetase
MINKEKLEQFDDIIDQDNLIGDKFIVAQRGKKNYFLLIAE